MDRSNKRSIDTVDLLAEHYEAVEMPDGYRRTLLNSTRSAVADRKRVPLLRWAVGLAGVAAAAVVLLVMLYLPQSPAKHKSAPRRERIAQLEKGTVPPRIGGNSRSPVVESRMGTAGTDTKPTQQQSAARIGSQASQGAAIVFPPTDTTPVVVVVSLQQPVRDGSGRVIEAGDRLTAQTPIRTGVGGRATLVTARGSELHLGPNSELVFSAKKAATITRGRLYCANRNEEIARIDTPAGQVRLLGTVVDTAVVDKSSVAVTVVEGRVQLSNKHGKALVDAGKQSVLTAFRAPQGGKAVNTARETAWYQGRGEYQSDFGDIAYVVQRADGLVSEVWTMKADGSDRHRVKSYVGRVMETGQWLPGEQWLSLQTHSLLWTTPDVEKRRAHTGAGHSIAKTRTWLLNAVTGQEVLFRLPEGYDPLYMSFSPNAQLMAFCGSYNPAPGSWDNAEGGVWVYDSAIGNITKVFDGWIKTPVSWAPDGGRLAISSGEDYTNEHTLMLIDTHTGKVHDLKATGAGVVFSPDGNKLAYCGDFKSRGSWFNGVPTSGSIFVLDLTSGGDPVRLSPPEDNAIMPRWSPDGSRIAYSVSTKRVCVVNTDGTELHDIYQTDSGTVNKISWAPGGDTLFVSVTDYRVWKAADAPPNWSATNWSSRGIKETKTLLVAADGSGIVKTLHQSGGECDLPKDVEKQTEAASSEMVEAVFQFAMGKVRSFEGDIDARRKSYNAAADIFAGLVWKYPLSGLSMDDVRAYADAAAEQAGHSDAAVLHNSCKERMSYLDNRVALAALQHNQFAPDLPTLLDWLSSISWQANWLHSSDKEHVKMLGLCPGDTDKASTSYIYTPPADGSEPKVGDVLLRCPLHPDVCFEWDEYSATKINLHLMRDSKPGAFCQVRERYVPYRLENVGDGPLNVIYHALSNSYEIQGKARLLPTGRVYSDETIELGPLDEGSIARSIDSAGFVDWGRLPEDEAKKAQEALDFCRCVARFEAGLGVDDCELLKDGFHYKAIDNEPARILFSGPAGGSCGTLDSSLRFELIGPGDIKLYQLKPSGRFRVYGTVRVVQTKQVCTNGWIDKNGNVTYTEQ